MLGKTYEDQTCSVARTLELVGERWSMLIIRDALFAECSRFGDFQRSLGIATNVLATRLESFVESGLMERQSSSGSGRPTEYLLTDKGRALQPVVLAMAHWGDEYAAPDGPPIIFEHADCGHPIEPQIHCPHCGPVERAVISARLGPGTPVAAAEIPAVTR
jgi:DNA-binding HxlR family transcriptional regulator